MYEELGAVKEPVELTPTEALTSAEELLKRQGYRIIYHSPLMVVGKRENRSGLISREQVHLAVFARPHPEGGLRITLMGDDREGVRERQGEWSRWGESLPKIGRWEKKQHQEEPEKPQNIETSELRRERDETTGTTTEARRHVSKERKEESYIGKPPSREARPQPANAREEKCVDKLSGRGSGAWTSVAPWERKARVAPGKVDEKLNEPR